MVRARLASLTLAGGLLAAASGCCGLWEGWRPFRHGSGAPDCTCYEMGAGPGGTVPTSIQVPSSGPVLVSPETMPFTGPPPSAAPLGPPPRIVPIPATPMPWTGQN